jgi:CubicO group peptidase (beta-lactamase class C family)
MTVVSIIKRCKRKSLSQRIFSLILLMGSVSLFFSGCSSAQIDQEGEASAEVSTSTPTSASASESASTPTSISSQTSDEETKIIQDLSSYLDQLSAEDKYSGVVLLAKDGVSLFEQAYGYANRASESSNNLDTKFNMASVGKMFTAVAIMQLIQEGKLSLDDYVIDLIPDYPNKDAASKITVQQLLTHTSGLGDIFTDAYQKSDQSQYRTLESYLSIFADKPLQFEPGEKYAYSNAGFIVLGLIIENVTGEDYYQYVDKNIFDPAGMTDTGFYSESDNVSNMALGYTNRVKLSEADDGTRTVAPHLGTGTSAGGVYSTVADMLRFSEALQDYILIDAEWVDLLFAGNGIVSAEENGVRIVGHSGGNNGVSTNIDIYPDLGYTVIALSNYDEGPKLFNQRLRWQLTGNAMPQTMNLSTADLKTFEGQYKSEAPASGEGKNMIIMGPGGSEPQKQMPITITAVGNGLQVSLRGSVYKFVPVSTTEFYDYADPQSRLSFTKDDNGQITGLSVEGGQIREKAVKQV